MVVFIQKVLRDTLYIKLMENNTSTQESINGHFIFKLMESDIEARNSRERQEAGHTRQSRETRRERQEERDRKRETGSERQSRETGRERQEEREAVKKDRKPVIPVHLALLDHLQLRCIPQPVMGGS